MAWIVEFFALCFVGALNIGLGLGAILGAVLLIRPLTRRLLSCRQQMLVWAAAWTSPYFAYLYDTVFGLMRVDLPFPTFREWLASRTGTAGMFVVDFLPLPTGAGTYHIALPGGAAIPVYLPGWLQGALAVAGAIVLAVPMIWCMSRFNPERRIRQLARAARPLPEETYTQLGVPEDENISLSVGEGLSTSFVVRGLDRGRWGGVGEQVVLQEGLTPEQQRLVVLHEVEHVRQRHIGLQALAAGMLYLCIWNPVIWLAYRMTCRDMELACDQGVLAKLDSRGRRAYARTLVELGRERPVWSGVTTFGENNIAYRVKRVADWKPDFGWGAVAQMVGGWTLAVLLSLFLVGGDTAGRDLPQDLELRWQEMLSGPELVTELTEEVQLASQSPERRVVQVWAGTSGQEPELFCRDSGGVWWSGRYFWSSLKSEYRLTRVERSQGTPDLTGLVRLEVTQR